jgi:methylmalonyl-CoA/ethylmalonyl-CoA epimerase
MNIKRIIHIGIYAGDMDPVKKLYTDILGLSVSEEEVYEGHTDICFLPVGDSQLELCASIYPDGEVAQLVAEQGEGIDHIAFEVDDLEAAIQELKDKGVPLQNEEPLPGAQETIVAYLDPAATHGVLIELVQSLH